MNIVVSVRFSFLTIKYTIKEDDMQDNEPYVMTKKRTVRRIYKGRVIAFIVAVCLAVILGAVWFSRSTGKMIAKAREYSFVSVGKYAALGEASAKAAQLVDSGGAGYLYGKNEYKVVASCYAQKSDAQQICDRLTEKGENAEVFTLKSSVLAVDRSDGDNAAIKRMLKLPYDIFDELYGISLKIDKNEISQAAAVYAARKMSASCSECFAECKDLSGEAGKRLAFLFSALADTLDMLADRKDNVPQAVKYALCDTAVKICEYTSDSLLNVKNMS